MPRAPLLPFTAERPPVSMEQTHWPGGLALTFALYLGDAELPDELVTSVRCIVTVGDQLLVCENAHSAIDVWPGGRREAGESWAETACRELYEETGVQLMVESLSVLGFLHFRHTSPVPRDHPFPHPDFLQVVMHGRASAGTSGWVDTEGYIQRSWLVDLNAAESLTLSEAERHAIRAARSRIGQP